MLGTMEQQGEAVGVAVDVDEFAVECDGVGAHEEPVCADLLAPHGILLLRRGGLRAVDHAVTVGLQGRFDAAFGKRDASAPGDALARFYEVACELDRLCGGMAVVAGHVANREFLDDVLRGGAACGPLHIFHAASSAWCAVRVVGGGSLAAPSPVSPICSIVARPRCRWC